MNAVAIVVLMLLYLRSVEASDPDASVCFANQELSLFCDAKVFLEAKKSCEDRNSYLVKVDSANMTEVVNSLIDKTKCPHINGIFIGGIATYHPDFPKDRSKRTWNWFDGSKVNLPAESGYQNWQRGQPNDYDNQEDCLILDKYTKQWKDTICNGSPPDPKYSICQKTAEVHHEVVPTLNEFRCEATTGSCRTHIEWRRDSISISNSSGNDVYQISNLTSSILQYKNATIVNGTSEVIDIRSFTCNTSLQIVWKPQFQSLGFLHRIEAIAIHYGKLKKVVEVTPTDAAVQFTTVAELESSTKYQIKVVACKDVNNCADEYATMKTATTSLGIILTVNKATIYQNTLSSYHDICVVTWQWTHKMTDTFRITFFHNSSETLNTSIVEQTNFTKNDFYFFTPFPGREYNVETQPVTNENYCPKPVKAVGSFIGKKFPVALDQSNTSAVVAMGVVIFLLLVVIFSMAICMHMRSTESTQTPMPETGDVHNYATVRNPKINEAAYLDLTDKTVEQTNCAASAGNFAYENVDQNLSPAYETVNNKPTSEYEM